MFSHILIPTDGTKQSDKAIENGIALAKKLGAKVTAVNCSVPWSAIAVGEIVSIFPEAEYVETQNKEAQKLLDTISDKAKAAGIEVTTRHLFHNHAYQGILETAKEAGCDLICMASHGRRGLEGLLIGSETTKTLTHSEIPVLVYK